MVNNRNITTYFFVIVFIFFSFYGRTIGHHNTINRISPSDYFGFLAIAFSVILPVSIKVPKPFIYAFFLLFTYSFGLIATNNLTSTIMELLIFLYLILISLMVYNSFNSKRGLLTLIHLIAIVGIVSSSIGIYDFTASLYGLPRIFPAPDSRLMIVVSGFRNGGQAGIYFLTLLSILIPSVYTQKKYPNFKLKRVLVLVSICLLTIALFLTVKVVAYIGFALAIFLLILLRGRIKLFIFSICLVFVILIASPILINIFPSFYNRLKYKIEQRIIYNLDANANDGKETAGLKFVRKNYGGALTVFKNNFFYGSGIGGFHGTYNKHEVHSTYFKIIGETGMFGIVGFIPFIICFIRLSTVYKVKSNEYSTFIYYFAPFALSFLVVWIYNYPIRKREFWILFALLCIVQNLNRTENKRRILII